MEYEYEPYDEEYDSYYEEHEDLSYGWDEEDLKYEEELYDGLTVEEVIEVAEACYGDN